MSKDELRELEKWVASGRSPYDIVGLQNLYGHLSLLQQFTDEDRNQILRFLRITRYFFLEKLFEALFQHIQELRC